MKSAEKRKYLIDSLKVNATWHGIGWKGVFWKRKWKAVQNQAISTNNIREHVHSKDIPSLFWMCGKFDEAIAHIVSAQVFQNEYKQWIYKVLEIEESHNHTICHCYFWYSDWQNQGMDKENWHWLPSIERKHLRNDKKKPESGETEQNCMKLLLLWPAIHTLH